MALNDSATRIEGNCGVELKRMLFWHWLSIRDDLGKLTGGKESDRVWIVVLIYDRWTGLL